jgi:hypothetical protein
VNIADFRLEPRFNRNLTVTVTMRIRRSLRYRVQTAVGVWLVRLGARIAEFGFKVEEES